MVKRCAKNSWLTLTNDYVAYAGFTHAGLTTRYWMESL